MNRDKVREWLEESCRKSGVPLHVTDPEALTTIATLWVPERKHIMDATPTPGSIEIVETAICQHCKQGIHKQGAGKWQHNDWKTQCYAGLKKTNKVEIVNTGDHAYGEEPVSIKKDKSVHVVPDFSGEESASE